MAPKRMKLATDANPERQCAIQDIATYFPPPCVSLLYLIFSLLTGLLRSECNVSLCYNTASLNSVIMHLCLFVYGYSAPKSGH